MGTTRIARTTKAATTPETPHWRNGVAETPATTTQSKVASPEANEKRRIAKKNALQNIGEIETYLRDEIAKGDDVGLTPAVKFLSETLNITETTTRKYIYEMVGHGLFAISGRGRRQFVILPPVQEAPPPVEHHALDRGSIRHMRAIFTRVQDSLTADEKEVIQEALAALES